MATNVPNKKAATQPASEMAVVQAPTSTAPTSTTTLAAEKDAARLPCGKRRVWAQDELPNYLEGEEDEDKVLAGWLAGQKGTGPGLNKK